jgi:hypothetical protein
LPVLVSARSSNSANGSQFRSARSGNLPVVSKARDKLDGGLDLDQGIVRDGKANFVPSDENGIAFSRTPQQVLRIVYLTSKDGVTGGGFHPKGMNGALQTT